MATTHPTALLDLEKAIHSLHEIKQNKVEEGRVFQLLRERLISLLPTSTSLRYKLLHGSQALVLEQATRQLTAFQQEIELLSKKVRQHVQGRHRNSSSSSASSSSSSNSPAVSTPTQQHNSTTDNNKRSPTTITTPRSVGAMPSPRIYRLLFDASGIEMCIFSATSFQMLDCNRESVIATARRLKRPDFSKQDHLNIGKNGLNLFAGHYGSWLILVSLAQRCLATGETTELQFVTFSTANRNVGFISRTTLSLTADFDLQSGRYPTYLLATSCISKEVSRLDPTLPDYVRHSAVAPFGEAERYIVSYVITNDSQQRPLSLPSPTNFPSPMSLASPQSQISS